MNSKRDRFKKSRESKAGVASYDPIVTVLVATTTATIASIFLCMTFRIDRGTRFKAESVAKKAMKGEVKKARECLTEIEKDAGVFLRNIETDAGLCIDKIEKGVERINLNAGSVLPRSVRIFCSCRCKTATWCQRPAP